MLLFLSWSGGRSKAVAELLQQWFQEVIQAVEPWMSSDIEKGQIWITQLGDRLEQSKVGILCLTAESLNSPWIYYEAGALAKTKDALVCNLLIDILPEAVQFPLAQFQHTTILKDDIKKLVESINGAVIHAGEKGLSETLLERVFERNWTRLEQQLEGIQGSQFHDDQPPPAEEPLDMFAEIIGLVLSQSAPNGLNLEELTPRIFKAMAPNNNPPPMQPAVLAVFASEVERKHLPKLLRNGLVGKVSDRYFLTDQGKEHFAEVGQRQKTFQEQMLAAMKAFKP
jgi:hypothetical protein